jgi:glucose-6-phosphate 1-dehydrogenase
MNPNQPIPRAGEPCAIVIFGASGDLTKRKLIPSLYNLASYHLLPKNFSIIGISRSDWTDEGFQNQLGKDLAQLGTQPVDPNIWSEFQGRMLYCSGSFDDPKTYEKLGQRLAESAKRLGTNGNVLFYLSVQPSFFATIAKMLAQYGLTREEGNWRRVIIEKPFGHDLPSALELNRNLTSALQEHQIYRIDHYLGKETAQNLLVFRLGNAVFEPIWNRRYIDHFQLTVAESIGVEGRGAFYESAGAFRDVMQNHMFMLLALIAMEPPNSLQGEAVRNEKVKLLQAVRSTTPEEALASTVRGQYGPGQVGGQSVPGYRQERNVNPESTVETYAAVKLMIDNWRWAGVPFYLRSGKRLAQRTTKIVVRFKVPPLALFGSNENEMIAPNRLIFNIQPDEGITFQVRAKVPGPTLATNAVHLDFDYSQFGDRAPTTGYEKLLYDCMVGDSTLFHRSDMVEAAWEAAQPILDAWGNNPPKDFPNYAAGTWGPAAADELLERDVHKWWYPSESGISE